MIKQTTAHLIDPAGRIPQRNCLHGLPLRSPAFGVSQGKGQPHSHHHRQSSNGVPDQGWIIGSRAL